LRKGERRRARVGGKRGEVRKEETKERKRKSKM